MRVAIDLRDIGENKLVAEVRLSHARQSAAGQGKRIFSLKSCDCDICDHLSPHERQVLCHEVT